MVVIAAVFGTAEAPRTKGRQARFGSARELSIGRRCIWVEVGSILLVALLAWLALSPDEIASCINDGRDTHRLRAEVDGHEIAYSLLGITLDLNPPSGEAEIILRK